MEIRSTRIPAIHANRAATTLNTKASRGSFQTLLSGKRSQAATPATATDSVSRSSGLVSLGLRQQYVATTVVNKAATQDTGVKFNPQQQNWLDANTGVYANLLVNNLNRTEPYSIDPVNINWINESNGAPQSITRAVGNVTPAGGAELAKLLGGTLVDSPFNTFGTSKKDQCIRLNNGQLIDASFLANSLNNARLSNDPFAATQDILNLYRSEADSYNLTRALPT